jgi:hypothetical protein
VLNRALQAWKLETRRHARIAHTSGELGNQAWHVWTVDGRHLVARRCSPFRSRAEVDYELEVLRQVDRLGWSVPVPAAEVVELDGRSWSLCAYVPGGPCDDGAETARRRGALLAGLHAAAPGRVRGSVPHVAGFWAATILLVLSSPILAIVFIALGVLFSNLSTAETRGVAMGVYGTVLFLGLGLGPAIFGATMQHAGYTAGFTACAATGLLMAALTIGLRSVRLPAADRISGGSVPRTQT